MSKSVLLQQLNFISSLLERLEALQEDLEGLATPWPEMKAVRDEAALCAKVAFDQVVLYQRSLLNHVGPKPAEGGE